MTHIYDILLNFNSDFYEFYEWEKTDYITHIKKIPIYKVNTSLIDDLLIKKIVIDSPITYEIMNKTEVFESKKIRILKYACLFTDGYRVIATLLSDDFSVLKLSDLLLDESSDTINISKRLTVCDVAYNIIGTKKDYSLLTRKEIKIKKYLLKEFKNSYKEKDINKLKYLYFEYFDTNLDDLDKIFLSLVDSLNLEITPKHIKLYELIKLSHMNVS